MIKRLCPRRKPQFFLNGFGQAIIHSEFRVAQERANGLCQPSGRQPPLRQLLCRAVYRLQTRPLSLLKLCFQFNFRMRNVPPVLVLRGFSIDHHFLLYWDLRSHPSSTLEPHQINGARLVLKLRYQSRSALPWDLVDAHDDTAQLNGDCVRGNASDRPEDRSIFIPEGQMFQ